MLGGLEVGRQSHGAAEGICWYVVVTGASPGSCELDCGAVAWAVRDK